MSLINFKVSFEDISVHRRSLKASRRFLRMAIALLSELVAQPCLTSVGRYKTPNVFLFPHFSIYLLFCCSLLGRTRQKARWIQMICHAMLSLPRMQSTSTRIWRPTSTLTTKSMSSTGASLNLLGLLGQCSWPAPHHNDHVLDGKRQI